MYQNLVHLSRTKVILKKGSQVWFAFIKLKWKRDEKKPRGGNGKGMRKSLDVEIINQYA